MDLPLVDRLRRLTGGVALLALAFSQAPGRIVGDSKLDLFVDPGRFLARALQAWDPTAAFGQLQNQAYGYLFPMGPFAWLGQAAGLPAWVVQRLWWSVLLLVAYTGFLRLARLLRFGTPSTQLVGALAYALGPRVVTELGAISVELLPLALLPWVLAPLVTGTRGGSVRRAAATSGLAVAAMGGVNAAAVLAVLVLPLAFLLSREPGPRRTRLLICWLGALALAVTWWFLPLLVLGRYAYPFLSFIETSAATTSVTSGPNVLRGTDHWLGFFVAGGRPTWPAGFSLATSAVPVFATVLVAGLGLVGLGRRSTPERRFLRWGLLVGLLAVGLGYAGAAGSPLAEPVRHLLDGGLAPFRNVHKFDPVLRLPLTLGLVAGLSLIPAAATRGVARLRGEDGRWLQDRPQLAMRAGACLALLPLLLSTAPAWTGALAAPGSFAAIPAWWPQTADWLAAHDDGGRALLEPASAFADYVWGRPQDEPLQTLARSPWAVRGAVPLGAPGATRLLDGIESLVATGRGSPDLAAALRRAGVSYVVLRNDLSADASATPPMVARAALVASPGLRRVAGFGAPIRSAAGSVGALAGPLNAPAAVEIFALDADSGTDLRAELLSGPPLGLSGGPEAVAGSLGVDPGTPLIAVADGGPTDRMLVTDTLRRRVLNFGAPATQGYGPTIAADADPAQGRATSDVTPYPGVSHQSTALLAGGPGVVSVTASSSAADPYGSTYRGAGFDAAAAFDGSLATAWVSDPADAAPSVRVTYRRPVALAGLVLRFDDLPAGVSRPDSVAVSVDGGRTVVRVDADVVPLHLTGYSASIGLRLASAAGGRSVGVAEVQGLPTVTAGLAVPADSAAAGPGTQWAFTRDPSPRRSCVQPGAAWVCSPLLGLPSGEPGDLLRTFKVGVATTAALGLTVLPAPGAALDALLDGSGGYAVTGSSTYVDDPADRPGAALDGDPATAWMTSADDASPTLTITYPEPVTLSGLSIAAPASSLRRIVGAVVRTDTTSRPVALDAGGSPVSFAPLTATSLTVTLQIRPGDGIAPVSQPLVVTGLSLTGAPAATADPSVAVPCGGGPALTVDGRTYTTAVSSTRQAVLAGAPLPATVCFPTPADLAAGGHRVSAMANQAFEPAGVTLTTPGADRSTSEPLPLHIAKWGAQGRRLVLPPGSSSGVLALDESFNTGWVATAAGRTLKAVRLDGWRQGWTVPPGTTGTVVLTFAPGGLQRTGLLVGAALLVLLLAFALAPVRIGRSATARAGPGRGTATGAVLGPLAFAVLLAGPTGLAAWWAGRVLGRRHRVQLLVGVVALLAAGSVWVAVSMRVGDAISWWLKVVLQGLTVAAVVIAVAPPVLPPEPERAASGAPQPGSAPRRAARMRRPPRGSLPS